VKQPPQQPAAQVADATRWWATLLDEDDPISLEPLAKLAYPPFSLRNQAPEPEPEPEQQPVMLERHTECHPRKASRAQQQQQQQQQQPAATASECVTHFDGRVLAHYLVSTLSFAHPITRRELSLSECEHLDAYLQANRLGRPRVVQAFKRKDEQSTTPEQSTMATSDVDLQAESAALLQSLFSSNQRAPIRAGRSTAAMRNARRLQAAVMSLRPTVAAIAAEPQSPLEEASNGGLLVRSDSARDPERPSAPTVSRTTVQAGDQGLMQYPPLYGHCPSQQEQQRQARGSWCAPVVTSSGTVDAVRDFPTLGGASPPQANSSNSKQLTRMQQRWGSKSTVGPRKPLTMAALLEPEF